MLKLMQNMSLCPHSYLDFSAMGDPPQLEIEMAHVSKPINAGPGVSPPTEEHPPGAQKCCSMERLWSTICHVKRLLMIIVLDIILGAVDIASDIINGTLFFNGGELKEEFLCLH